MYMNINKTGNHNASSAIKNFSAIRAQILPHFYDLLAFNKDVANLIKTKSRIDGANILNECFHRILPTEDK